MRWEFATPTGHSAGQQGASEFLAALAARPSGRAPMGRAGRPQSWNRNLGFHDDLSDDLADRLARHLSLVARALRESRKLDDRDAGFLRDCRLGQRPPSDLRVLEARQRKARFENVRMETTIQETGETQ
jgi:hypothetical protein